MPRQSSRMTCRGSWLSRRIIRKRRRCWSIADMSRSCSTVSNSFLQNDSCQSSKRSTGNHGEVQDVERGFSPRFPDSRRPRLSLALKHLFISRHCRKHSSCGHVGAHSLPVPVVLRAVGFQEPKVSETRELRQPLGDSPVPLNQNRIDREIGAEARHISLRCGRGDLE